MRRSCIAGLALLFVAPRSYASDVEALPVTVSIDWSAISDKLITRCNLQPLQNLLLQTLVEEGYAVVRGEMAAALALRLSADAGIFSVEGRYADEVTLRQLPIPRPCDGTFIVDLQIAVTRIAKELTRSRNVIVPQPEPLASPLAEHFSLEIGAGLSAPALTYPLAVVAGGLRYRLGAGGALTFSAEFGLRPAAELVVIEPVVGAAVSTAIVRRPGVEMEIGASAAILGHFFSESGNWDGHLGGRFGVPLGLRLPGLSIGLVLMPYLRLVPVTHRVFARETHRVDRWGGLLLVNWYMPVFSGVERSASLVHR